MEKPIKKYQSEPAIDYHEARDYINKKYNCDIDNYYNYKYDGSSTVPYCNFWHWLVDAVDIHNGCYFYLGHEDALEMTDEVELEDYLGNDWKFIQEVLRLFYKEFGENGEIYFHVEW